MAITPQDILNALTAVTDPDLKRDIVSLGYIKDLAIEGERVHFRIELTIPPGPLRDALKQEVQKVVLQLPGVKEVEVIMTSLVRKSSTEPPKKGYIPPSSPKDRLIPSVRHVIAVASGKGGVGKSTVTANLALALAKSGARVGIMDADVYGPTIPTLLGIDKTPEVLGDNRMVPIGQYGLKVISMGFFIQEGEAIVWRGPMLHKTIEQFLGGVVWGELDYLLCDMPPGTGDVQLSLCQIIPITGAVIISTPQDVALHVAQKAIYMFNKLNCPILGIVENMSHYICAHCGKRDDIFGSGGAKKAAQKLGIPFLGEIPLATNIRVTSDEGKPVVISNPDSLISQAFFKAGQNLSEQVKIKSQAQADIKISF